MIKNSCSIPYQDTGYFSKIVLDYISQNALLTPFYTYAPNSDAIQNIIEDRKKHPTDRLLLNDVFREQYKNCTATPEQEKNIASLLRDNTFTITTAHQPSIFTGPLYFIYKILHVIQIANTLNQKYSQYHFVPIYYMGSEDADVEEIGHLHLNGEKLVWQTKQTGAVGKMLVDEGLLKILERIAGEVGVLPYGQELITIFKNSYIRGKSIQEATLTLVNALFARYGLLTLIPDNVRLKKNFMPVVEKELNENFSHKALVQTIEALQKNYTIQASGRTVNLFYILEDKRERIEWVDNMYCVQNLRLQWTKEAIIKHLNAYPERFSGNVILRGTFQETCLPNLIFVGGGGEVAYWLELKNVFRESNVFYPMVVLRNSFVLLQQKDLQQTQKLGFTVTDLFQAEDVLSTQYVKQHSDNSLFITDEMQSLESVYQSLGKKVAMVDITLGAHVQALYYKNCAQLASLDKKILRAQKRKFAEERVQIARLKQKLFPTHNLQERVDNFSVFYAQYGRQFLDTILMHSYTFEHQMKALVL